MLLHSSILSEVGASTKSGAVQAAVVVGTLFRYQRDETLMIWSMTLPQVAATLAAATVAYRSLNAKGQPLIDHEVLNVILMLVVLTSLIAPLLTQRFASRLAIYEDIPPIKADGVPGIGIREPTA